jgi:hypothetical protein
MATRRRGCVVGRTWVSAQKGHNFWFDRWIALKCLQGFPELVFICVAMEWLLGDEDVWSVELEYRLKRAITFGPVVEPRSIVYRSFQRLFLLGKLWNRWVTRMFGRQPWVSAQKGHNFLSDRFTSSIFTGVSRGCFLWGSYGMATRWRGFLVCRTRVSAEKGHNFWSDRWITLKFLQGFPEVVFIG